MKTTQELSANWSNNPEPNRVELDGSIILDADDVLDDAYLWESTNSSEGWLSFNGELMQIQQ